MNSSTDLHNPPAFPDPGRGAEQSYSNETPLELSNGMTLRDYFAAQVIGPLMGSDGFEAIILKGERVSLDDLPRFAAKQAYEIADAMLKERLK